MSSRGKFSTFQQGISTGLRKFSGPAVPREILNDSQILMRILARARAGDFGHEGNGRPPGIWPISAGVRIGEAVFGRRVAHDIALGLVTPAVEVLGGQFLPPKTDTERKVNGSDADISRTSSSNRKPVCQVNVSPSPQYAARKRRA